MKVIQLYHSLNLLERVLAKLDEVDVLVSLIASFCLTQGDFFTFISIMFEPMLLNFCLRICSVFTFFNWKAFRWFLDALWSVYEGFLKILFHQTAVVNGEI